MALFPVYGRFVGDFVPHLVAADTDDTMDAVAEKVAVHAVGRRLARRVTPKGYDVYVDGRLIPAATTLGELGLAPLQWVDVKFRG
jgi:hypothetical protein